MKAFYHDTGLGKLCGLLGKSRQAFYGHLWRADRQALQEGLIVDLVRQQRRLTPGAGGRKLLHLLSGQWQQHGIQLGRDQFFGLLRRHDLLIRRRKKYVTTTQSRHWLKKYPNLAAGFTPEQAERLWVSDITYIAVGGRFCYLILITDAYSRKIVGYQLSESLSAAFCVNALEQALAQRQFSERQLMHHSDRGIQYCSQAYVKVLNGSSCQISMTQNGDPYENALAERVNGILKQEWNLDQTFGTFEQAQAAIDNAVYHYNHSRPHASCDYLTPSQAHSQNGILAKRWKPMSKNYKTKTCININTVPRLFGLTFESPHRIMFFPVKPSQDYLLTCKVILGRDRDRIPGRSDRLLT
ncbi:MAG: IS3 family transposase [Lewinellaceae bacterium]|nr:IS3 family transposase [Lewinellaceae bacterium]MCB9334456.1 IS3 family transposase [Lewinellaceae bacterium]